MTVRNSSRHSNPARLMDTLLETAARILEIESRQDDALRQLAELERRVTQVLAEFLPATPQAAFEADRAPLSPTSDSRPASKAA